jgi:predicted nucleic acid-binding protein
VWSVSAFAECASPARPTLAHRFAQRRSRLPDVEVAHVLRRLVVARELSDERAREAIEDLLALPLQRHPHALFLHRAWEPRRSLTAHDAVHVALAEALDAPLVTCDARLARSHGHRARILAV